MRTTLFAVPILALSVAACGTNPVTGKREIQFVSEAQEVQLGEQQYAPTRQSEGGDLTVLPELTTYVNGVGQKLAAVADRKLPYEFVVLNSSVPNAWALPGGKIAVNRGLLTELKNEAELAAVLGHEIVHAAARHGAKAQERATMMQAGLGVAQIGAAVGGVDANLASLVLGGAGVGAQMVQQKYGREQELESDKYGMKYMKAAGYDPTGAVTLQETFVRLSSQGGKKEADWLEGLFASHPPSQERVDQNKKTAAELGVGGETGAEPYMANLKPLVAMKPAYDKYDAATAAAHKGDLAQAKSLAGEAIKLAPQEGRFQQLLGEIALSEKKPQEAVGYYQKAIQLSPNYFGSYLGGGVAQYRAGDKAKAEQWLTQSAKLLPTAPAAYFLGNLARDKGDAQNAVKYYQAAASSNSDIGKAAAAELVRLDLPKNPGNYLATGPQVASDGRLVLVIENRAPLALTDIQVTPVLVDGAGNVVQQGKPVTIPRALKPGERVTLDAGVGAVPQEQLGAVRFRIDSARVAENTAADSGK